MNEIYNKPIRNNFLDIYIFQQIDLEKLMRDSTKDRSSMQTSANNFISLKQILLS